VTRFLLRRCRLVVGVSVTGLALLAGSGCGQHYEEGSHPPPKPLPRSNVPLRKPGIFVPVESASPDEPGAISGVIRLEPKLTNKVPRSAVLYLIARERVDGGVPYLLKKVPLPSFPYAFTMGQADVGRMFGEGIVLAEIPEMYLIARIDQDGMAMPQPGDLEGTCLQNPIAGGAKDLEVVIDRTY
jgi:hypothetical protein